MTWMRWTVLSLSLFAGCREATTSTPAPTASTSASTASLTRVADASTVCMVNDRYMGSPQIAVPVGGKTYFGCCAMCKQKLETMESARTAIDPVSGKRVDKSAAVIGRNASGQIFYFESEENLARYSM